MQELDIMAQAEAEIAAEKANPIHKTIFEFDIDEVGIKDYIDKLEKGANLGDLSQAMFDIRALKDDLNGALKHINSVMGHGEYSVLRLMEELGLDSFKGSRGSISRKVTLYPSIVDMGEFIEFMHEANRPDMIQKRVSEAAFREYFELNGSYPEGLDAYPKAKLGFRKK